MVSIEKKIFDNLIEETNKRKLNDKSYFLKKFFPKFRMYSDDIINSMKNYFVREEFSKYSKIIQDSEYDEYVYIILSGKAAIVKSVERIKNLKEKLSGLDELSDKRYLRLDELLKGDIFGVYSAIKHHKNNYTVMVLSEKVEVYKIMKAHCLLYFGGYFGLIPDALKGIDCTQQNCYANKINYIENATLENLKKLSYIEDSYKHFPVSKRLIDESEINNNLKDAWMELNNLSNKINDFKSNLFKNNETKEKIELLEKMKKEEKDDGNE